MTDFTSYVNIKQGTASDMRFSSGNTLPLVSVPFGMHAYSMQTLGKGGGWQHCNAAIMRQDMMGFEPLPSGEWCKAITPPGYVEGPCMLKRNDLYHFMWSAGDWVNGGYHVSVSTSISPLDISEHGHIILQSSDIAEGPGHNGYLNLPGTDYWKIVYHRRILGDREPGHRVLCMDDLQFDEDYLHPVRMT